MTTRLQMNIGNRGGGKTLEHCWEAQYAHQVNPLVPIVGNTPIWFENLTPEEKELFRLEGRINKKGALLRREILKWLAIKTINQDRRYALILIDEAAISGLESRGSASVRSVPHTYLVALSRKINVDIRIASQLMSMADKRIQWLSDSYLLCIGHYKPMTRIPESFEYQVYDENLMRVNWYDIYAKDAAKWLFPRFDTADVPISDELMNSFLEFYTITDADNKQWQADMMGEKIKIKQKGLKPKYHQMRRWMKNGDKVRIDDKDYVVVDKIWDAGEEMWEYTLMLRFPTEGESQIEVESYESEEERKKAIELDGIQKKDAIRNQDQVAKEFTNLFDIDNESEQTFKNDMEGKNPN